MDDKSWDNQLKLLPLTNPSEFKCCLGFLNSSECRMFLTHLSCLLAPLRHSLHENTRSHWGQQEQGLLYVFKTVSPPLWQKSWTTLAVMHRSTVKKLCALKWWRVVQNTLFLRKLKHLLFSLVSNCFTSITMAGHSHGWLTTSPTNHYSINRWGQLRLMPEFNVRN